MPNGAQTISKSLKASAPLAVSALTENEIRGALLAINRWVSFYRYISVVRKGFKWSESITSKVVILQFSDPVFSKKVVKLIT